MLVFLRLRQPGIRLVGARQTPAAIQHRTQEILANIPRFDRPPLRLGHLPDLFIQGHLCQQGFHPLLV